MNFMTLNIRGIGTVGKVPWVKGMVTNLGVDFLALQESMLTDGKPFDYSSVWGQRDYGVDSVGSIGNSGGLINLWNPKKFRKMSSVEDRNYLVTTGSLVEDGSIINVVNVYAQQKLGEKRVLWEKLKGLMMQGTGMWILLGDFNNVRWQEERKNSKFKRQSALEFNSFIDDVSLQEYFMRGNKFTFMTGVGQDLK